MQEHSDESELTAEPAGGQEEKQEDRGQSV